MDLPFVTSVARPTDRNALPAPLPGDAFLAGGTWLFSDPQPQLRRLIDLASLGWPALRIEADALHVAATCTLAQLERLDCPAGWAASHLLSACCRSLLGSFKVRARATVGGNLCLALPAGPIAALGVALDATCVVWSPAGTARTIACADFVTGPSRNALAAGELLREIVFPRAALSRRAAMRRMSLTSLGRSAALLIGTLDDARLSLTVTAATPRPRRLDFPAGTHTGTVLARLMADIDDWPDDVHGAPDWRAHVTARLAAEIVEELSA